MRNLWKGLFISGVAWAVIGLVVMATRGKRQRVTRGQRARQNLVKVAKVGLPLARASKSGQTYLSKIRRKR